MYGITFHELKFSQISRFSANPRNISRVNLRTAKIPSHNILKTLTKRPNQHKTKKVEYKNCLIRENFFPRNVLFSSTIAIHSRSPKNFNPAKMYSSENVCLLRVIIQ